MKHWLGILLPLGIFLKYFSCCVFFFLIIMSKRIPFIICSWSWQASSSDCWERCCHKGINRFVCLAQLKLRKLAGSSFIPFSASIFWWPGCILRLLTLFMLKITLFRCLPECGCSRSSQFKFWGLFRRFRIHHVMLFLPIHWLLIYEEWHLGISI